MAKKEKHWDGSTRTAPMADGGRSGAIHAFLNPKKKEVAKKMKVDKDLARWEAYKKSPDYEKDKHKPY